MDLLVRILEALAVLAGFPLSLLSLYLLAKLFPFKPDAAHKENVSFDVLRNKYAKWDKIALIPFFAFSGLGSYLIFQGLIWIFHNSFPQTYENRYVLLPDQYFFALPAMLVGILLSVFPVDLLFRLLLKKNYAEYVLYGNKMFGIDVSKVFKLMSILLVVPSMILTVLAMDCYAKFTDDQMITNRYWGIGEIAHNYSQITRIKSVRFFENLRGETIENPYHVVYFNDGSSWSTRNTFYRADQDLKLSDEKEKQILTFVAEKCGRQIERYDFLNGKED
jgi:hypothetical protein